MWVDKVIGRKLFDVDSQVKTMGFQFKQQQHDDNTHKVFIKYLSA